VLFGFLLYQGAVAADLSPLDRLRQRSGEARWEQLRSQWTPLSQEEPTTFPTVSDPAAEAAPAIDDTPSHRDAPADDALLPVLEWDPPHTDAPAPFDQRGVRRPISRKDAAELPTSGRGDLGSQLLLAVLQDRYFATLPHPNPVDTLVQTDVPLPLSEFLGRQLWESQQSAQADWTGELRRGSPVVAAIGLQEPEPPEQAPRPLPDVAPITLRPISSIQPFYDYQPEGKDPCEYLCPLPEGRCPPDDPRFLCPEEVQLQVTGSTERYFAHIDYCWAATNLYHNPLYFEDPLLERYGHVRYNECVQPFASLGRFGAQFIGLPYQWALTPPCETVYPLGWYRPGEHAPRLWYQVPWNARAAGTAAAIYTGLFLFVP
jgi:hypothetical protein